MALNEKSFKEIKSYVSYMDGVLALWWQKSHQSFQNDSTATTAEWFSLKKLNKIINK